MDIRYQSKLLKVLEDKRVNFESAYYDAENLKSSIYKNYLEMVHPQIFV